MTETEKGIIVECDCGYKGIRWNNNLSCKLCGLERKVVAGENE